MAKKSKRVILEKLTDRKIARIVLNRADKHNAIDLQMIEEWMEALEEVRNDNGITVILTKGNGPSFGAGLDLNYLRAQAPGNVADWQRSSVPRGLSDMIREYPKVTIAQIHGYCLGHAMVNMCSHDLAFAADTTQIGMPELRWGSFGQMATANLFHSGIPLKKAAMIQLSTRFISGAEADRLGFVSASMPEEELEAFTLELATEIASRNPAGLAAAKVAVQMGSKVGVGDAMRMDQLVGAWQMLSVNPADHIEQYLAKSKGSGKKTRAKR
jgi:enoyl-CoA hydratase/carnithine racemase